MASGMSRSYKETSGDDVVVDDEGTVYEAKIDSRMTWVSKDSRTMAKTASNVHVARPTRLRCLAPLRPMVVVAIFPPEAVRIWLVFVLQNIERNLLESISSRQQC